MGNVEVNLPIRFGQFVEYASLAGSDAETAELVGAGKIVVNGIVETRRGHRLSDDDVVAMDLPNGRRIGVRVVAAEDWAERGDRLASVQTDQAQTTERFHLKGANQPARQEARQYADGLERVQTGAERRAAGGSSLGVTKVRPVQQTNRLRHLTGQKPLNPGRGARLDLGACGIGRDATTFDRKTSPV